jgi:hypothetical protein
VRYDITYVIRRIKVKVNKKATFFGCVKLRISEVREERHHIAVTLHSIIKLRARSRPDM